MKALIATICIVCIGIVVDTLEVQAQSTCKPRSGYTVTYDKRRKRCQYKNSPTGNWTIKTSRDSFTGESFVYAYLPANGAIQGFSRSYKPMLYVRCKDEVLDIFIAFGPVMSCSEEIYDIRLDNSEPISVYTVPADDCSTMFIDDSDIDNYDLLFYMSQSSKFRIRADVYSVGDQTATFNVKGAGPVYDRIIAACPEEIEEGDE